VVVFARNCSVLVSFGNESVSVVHLTRKVVGLRTAVMAFSAGRDRDAGSGWRVGSNVPQHHLEDILILGEIL
jgi:hypothetical protein